MTNEKAALNLCCHAGGQWKDDGSKSVKAASVNGVVVWSGNPPGGRGESEKEEMTGEGGDKWRVQSYATENAFLYILLLCDKTAYTHAVVKQWSVYRRFFPPQQNKCKRGHKNRGKQTTCFPNGCSGS